MNRTTTIELNGREYTLCYSTRVVRSIENKFGCPGNMAQKMESDSAIERTETLLFVLCELIKAGAIFAEMERISNPKPLSLDELHLYYPIMHPRIVAEKIKEAITLGAAVSSEIKEIKVKGKKPQKKLKMNSDRYIWYGLHIGLDYNTTLDIPHGELLSLIQEQQIQNGTAEEVIKNEDDDPIPSDWE